MKDSFDAGLRMLSDMARQPAFAPAEIERQRQQMLSGQQVSREDPEYIANSVFDRLVYGFHPYGMPDNGTPQTHRRPDARRSGRVSHALLRAEQRDPRDRRRRDGRGSVRRGEEGVRRLGRSAICRRRPSSSRPIRRGASSSSTSRTRCRPKIRVGHLGIPRSHPDYMAVNLAIRILGGEGSNRLHQVLRTERGADLRRAGQHGHAQGDAATSRPRPTRAPTRPAKCCG